MGGLFYSGGLAREGLPCMQKNKLLALLILPWHAFVTAEKGEKTGDKVKTIARHYLDYSEKCSLSFKYVCFNAFLFLNNLNSLTHQSLLNGPA